MSSRTHPPRSVPHEEKEKSTEREIRFIHIPGTSDALPSGDALARAIAVAGNAFAEAYRFILIETPAIERAELFTAAFGTASVRAESLVSWKRGREEYALRADSIVSIIRSFIEHRAAYLHMPFRGHTNSTTYRCKAGSASGIHENHEWNYIVIGDGDPVYDGELIVGIADLIRSFKLKQLIVTLAVAGCRVCRPSYRERVRHYYHTRRGKLCKQCDKLFEQGTPLRLFSCVVEGCRALRAECPLVLDYLCQGCNNHLKAVLELVEDNGVTYDLDPYLVPDVDYHNRTVFYMRHPAVTEPIVRGGRCDYLAETIGGRGVPVLAATVSLEQLAAAILADGTVSSVKERPRIFFIGIGDQAKKASVRVIHELRRSGIVVGESLGKKSFKLQLKAAEKDNAALSLLFGQREVFEGTVILRDMVSGAQETVLRANIVDEVRRRVRGL